MSEKIQRLRSKSCINWVLTPILASMFILLKIQKIVLSKRSQSHTQGQGKITEAIRARAEQDANGVKTRIQDGRQFLFEDYGLKFRTSYAGSFYF